MLEWLWFVPMILFAGLPGATCYDHLLDMPQVNIGAAIGFKACTFDETGTIQVCPDDWWPLLPAGLSIMGRVETPDIVTLRVCNASPDPLPETNVDLWVSSLQKSDDPYAGRLPIPELTPRQLDCLHRATVRFARPLKNFADRQLVRQIIKDILKTPFSLNQAWQYILCPDPAS